MTYEAPVMAQNCEISLSSLLSAMNFDRVDRNCDLKGVSSLREVENAFRRSLTPITLAEFTCTISAASAPLGFSTFYTPLTLLVHILLPLNPSLGIHPLPGCNIPHIWLFTFSHEWGTCHDRELWTPDDLRWQAPIDSHIVANVAVSQ